MNETFTCQCHEEYTGERCEELLSPCLSSPCHSLATCVNIGVGGFECECPQGYTGELCNEDIDPCDPNPCRMDENCDIIDAQNYLCREITTGNIPPIQEEGINIISNAEVSHSNTLMNTIVPLTSLSLCCLLLGL